MSALLSFFKRKPTTPEELKDSKEARASFKDAVGAAKRQLNTAIEQNKKAGFKQEDFKAVEALIKTAEEWLFQNSRPFAQDAIDMLDTFQANLTAAYEDIQERGPTPEDPKAAELKAKKEEEKQKKDEKEKASKPKPWGDQSQSDVLWSALTIVFNVCLGLFVVALALRLASFASNEVIAYPVPFRILTFVYALLLPIYSLPWYIYEKVQKLRGKRPELLSEALIPIYESKEPSENFLDKILTWFRYPELSERIQYDTSLLEAARKKVLAAEQ